MKVTALLALSAAVVMTGCGPKDDASQPKSTEPGGNPITAPVDYLGSVAQAKKSMEKNIDTVSLQQNITLFQAQEGHFPKDLDELVTQKYLPYLPKPPYGMKFVYDATKGVVSVVPAK